MALLAALLLILLRWQADPAFVWLTDRDGAQWITYPRPPQMVARANATDIVTYRAQFHTEVPPAAAPLTFKAFGTASVFVNRQPVSIDPSPHERWKDPREVDIASHLQPGDNTLRVTVTNQHGPAMLRAAIPVLNVRTGPTWETSLDGRNWAPARPSTQIEAWPISRQFPSALREWAITLPMLLPVFMIVYVLVRSGQTEGRLARIPRFAPSPATVRSLLIIAVLILGFNNLFKLGLNYGFDWGHHLDYIHFIPEQGRLPLANEGLQGFQPPLFYCLGALLHSALSLFFDHDTVDRAIRLLPILAGAAQIEIAYRLSRIVFPGRAQLQSIATLCAALLPMNLYMSQMIGNESLFALIGALCLYQSARILSQEGALRRKEVLVLGAVLGLAFLTKASALLLIFPVTAALAIRAMRAERPLRSAVSSLAGVAAIALAISGWFYLRNLIHFGQFFIGGWDTLIGFEWWHQPGYRTIHQYTQFGEALIHPIYSMLPSFWDGLYATLWLDGHLGGVSAYEGAPPWNYPMMLAGAWWGLLPTLAIAAGFIAIGRSTLLASLNSLVFDSRHKTALILCAFTCLVFYAAVLAHTLVLPFYNACKASYALASSVCLACLIAAGLDWAARTPKLRASLYALLACWGAASYAAYFII